MKIDEIYKGQGVGLSHRGKVITGKVIKVFEDIVAGQKVTLVSIETP